MARKIDWDDIVEKSINSKSKKIKNRLCEKLSENSHICDGLTKKEIVQLFEDCIDYHLYRTLKTSDIRNELLKAKYDKYKNTDYHADGIEFSIEDEKQKNLLHELILFYVGDNNCELREIISPHEKDMLQRVFWCEQDGKFKISEYQQDLILNVLDYMIEADGYIWMNSASMFDPNSLGSRLHKLGYKISIQYNYDETYLCDKDLIYDMAVLRDLIENL